MWWHYAAVAAVFLLALVIVVTGRRAWIIHESEFALLYVNGLFKRELGPGRHTFWTVGREVDVARLNKFAMNFDTGLIDVVSSDRFPMRLGAGVIYKIADPKTAREQGFHTEFKFAVEKALVAVAAEKTLTELLAERDELGEKIAEQIRGKELPIEIHEASVTGLTLPPEIRRLVVEVERAKLEGLAQLERARGEDAAMRKLANTAKLLKGNPELLNLRALQAAAEGKNTTLVLGANGLIRPDTQS